MNCWNRAALLVALPLTSACVTNIEQKSAQLCAPLANQTPEVYADCVTQMSGQLDAKNRRTARIIAAMTSGNSGGDPLALDAAPTGFLKGDFISGTNRICVYDVLGSDRYVTKGATDICPLTD